MPRPPNIVICQADQLRAFEVGCYGHPVVRTPNIDRLAAAGTRFETAVTSFPVCMAARSALLSGQYARRCTNGVANFAHVSEGHVDMPEYPAHGRPHLPDPTLPEILADHGYHNAAIGKWHIHTWPHDVGFHEYLIPRVHHCHTGQSYTRNGGPEFVPPGYSVDFEAAEVERFLADRRGAAEPFFLYYNISPPHCPLADAPERVRAMYDPAAMVLRPNADPDGPLPNGEYHLRVYRWDFRFYNHHLPHTETLPAGYGLRELHAEYAGMTTWADECVGRMLDALHSAGLEEQTVVLLTSDHGDNLGSHGRAQKDTLDEESIRVPLVVRCAGRPARAPRVASGHVASTIDVMPTLLELAGLEPPAHVHGSSLAPILRGEREALERPHAFVETGGDGVGVRTPTHLYGVSRTNRRDLAERPHRFHDLRADPYQLRNLAGGGEQVETARALDSLLRAWDARTPWMHRDAGASPGTVG